jgi:hypothetical protein
MSILSASEQHGQHTLSAGYTHLGERGEDRGEKRGEESSVEKSGEGIGERKGG